MLHMTLLSTLSIVALYNKLATIYFIVQCYITPPWVRLFAFH